MASIPYETILSSDFFKFIVGPENKEFLIHSAVVAAQSPSLEKLVNGEMKEARERYAVWEHVDLHTFLCFSEFAYTGDYQEAERPGGEEHHPSAEELERVRNLELEAFLYQADPVLAAKQKEEEEREGLWGKFRRLYPGPETESGKSGGRSGRYNPDAFLSHAKMYVFADYYGITSLRLLSLRKLRQALELFRLRDEHVGDVVQLVRYAYENTMDRGDETDALRSLVNMYAACKVEELWKHKDFCSLAETNGEFSKGLITEMLGRLA